MSIQESTKQRISVREMTFKRDLKKEENFFFSTNKKV